MRINGTQYPEVEILPTNALPVSKFATERGMQVGHVYIKYQRHYKPEEGKKPGTAPDYIIRSWKGANFVIPIN